MPVQSTVRNLFLFGFYVVQSADAFPRQQTNAGLVYILAVI